MNSKRVRGYGKSEVQVNAFWEHKRRLLGSSTSKDIRVAFREHSKGDHWRGFILYPTGKCEPIRLSFKTAKDAKAWAHEAHQKGEREEF